MLPRYRSQTVAFREKQLLPIAVWLKKLSLSNNRARRTDENSSCNITNAFDLIKKQTESNRALFDFISQQSAATSFLQHVRISKVIPELTKFSLLDKYDPDIVSLKRKEVQDACYREIFDNNNNNNSDNVNLEQTRELIKWYRSVIDRPEFHIKQHLQQEISLVEHARWVCQKIAQEEETNSTSSTTKTKIWRPKCIVDVGGGSGYLALMAQQRILPDCETIVIDLHKPKHAIDDDQINEVRRRGFCNPFFRRVIKPIEDVDWRRDIRYQPEDVLVMSKHLCGGGLDQLLRTFQLQGYYPRGLCLSSCCHFKRLNTETYINPSFIKNLLLDVKHPWVFEVKRRREFFTPKGHLEPKKVLPEDEFPRSAVMKNFSKKDKNNSNKSCSCNIVPQESLEDFLLPMTEHLRQYSLVDYTNSEQKTDFTTNEYGKSKLGSRLRRAQWRIDIQLNHHESEVKEMFEKNGLGVQASSSSSSSSCDTTHEQKPTENSVENDKNSTSINSFMNDPFGGCFRAREYGRSQQKEGLRSLFSAITNRTNWVGTSDREEIWMQRVGRDLEGMLDGGRVEFLRNAKNFTHLDRPYSTQLVPFVPSDVSPRNRVLLGWRRISSGGGYFLTE